MNIIFGLLVISLLLATGFLAAFIWAVRSGQFEDTVTPGMRAATEDPTPTPTPASAPLSSRASNPNLPPDTP